ncbi:GDSL-type esterase/lipase family protein [Alteraurantiacibacter buctensis]|uniref:GDSL family lipase n=1 Tax=Alteraurantiacibacter buctensis TaxID=1503981 RepID=A0A844YVY7_9SPHN|nr:GDSL-type esterase/lipase family protein [Alteraurantiacibacter buctensis]MXO70237.1 GDSL family lipase [Alteraurantiacibacter buctensis]
MICRLFAMALLGLAAAPLAAQDNPAAPPVPMGRDYPAVNGTSIQCPLPQPRDAEALANQFEHRPRDLDDMSLMAASFFGGDNPAANAFRARQAAQFATDWPFRCRYRDANADLAASGVRPRVVFMGDSITEGWVEADPAFFADNGFVGRGISGQSSPQMLARFWQDVIALNPQAVHIMTGTNDIGGATGPITEEEYLGTVNAMIDLAQANDIRVVLAAMPPMSRLLPRPDFDTRPVVPHLNARLAELAAREGVTFVDYFTPLAAPDNAFNPAYANDGVHPTRAGYAVMEPLARVAIATALAD